MMYRKLKADYLFDGNEMHEDLVLICRQDGVIEEIREEGQSEDDIERFSGILSPGFVNCHCHLELSHLKNLVPENLGLVDFVLHVITQRHQSVELKQSAIIKAEAEMLSTGIVAVGDICNSADTLVQKSENRLDYYNFIELLGWLPERATAGFEIGKQLEVLFNNTLKNVNHLSLCPHAPYSISNKLWDLLIPGFEGKTITIHNQESLAENELFISGEGAFIRMYERLNMNSNHFSPPGTTSLKAYLPKLKTAGQILLVHNTFTEEDDLKAVHGLHKNLFFCICPNANLYIENRLPDIPLFMKHGIRMVLGTDSLASNHQLSILEEMKTIKLHYPLISTSEILLWACSNGAKALSYEKKLGSFEKGKRPGVVLIENLVEGEICSKSISRRIV